MAAVRQLQPEDQDAFYTLARYAFNKPQAPNRDAAFSSLYQHSMAWGSGEPLSSGLLGTHFEVDLAGVSYLMSGVGYVASYPEVSGQGGIGALMGPAFQAMRQNGETLSYLAPFAAPFYRRFGYEGAFSQLTHRIKAEDLPKLPQAPATVTVRRMAFKEARTLMQAVYQRNRHATRGGVRRADWWWQNLADHYPQREAAVALLGERPVGYVVYERATPTFFLHECFYDDLPALIALGRFVTAHRSAFADFVYTTANPDWLQDLLPEPGVLHTTVTPYMMARIVDVQDFMQRYPYQASDLAPLNIAIADPLVPQNAGLWQLAIDDGNVTFVRVKTGEAAVTLTIQQLVKAAFGVRPLREAYALGLVDGDAYTIASFGEMLLQKPAELYDYF